MDSKSLSHTRWNCIYHIVFIPKYRRKVMFGGVRKDMQEIIKKLCQFKQVEILDGSIGSDHIHICVSIPPKESVSGFMGYLKGKSALMIFDKYPQARGGDRHFWARGFYVDTVGRDEEKIRQYIQNQTEADRIEDRQR